MGISTHVLDTSLGRPAVSVPLRLSVLRGESWAALNEALTDADGRCKDLLPATHQLISGIYCVRFETSDYYARQHLTGLYPHVEIVFTVSPEEQHYHIPLLLTANGYTTYRGS